MEVVLETTITIDVEQDGGLWYVFVVGKRIGIGSLTRYVAQERASWLADGIQDLVEAADLMHDRAWKEAGK